MTKTDKNGQAQDLTPEQLNAIELLITGATDAEAAQAANVARQTVWGWRNNNINFIAALNSQRAAVWAGQTDKLRTLASKALDVLAADLDSEDQKLRQAAAVHILRAAGRYGQDLTPTSPTTPAGVRREAMLEEW